MDDRSVSAVISYVIVIGVIAILTATIVTSFAPLVTNQQADSVRATLDVIGQDIAGDIESADRLVARTGGNGTVELRTELPDRVGGNRYSVAFEESGNETEIRLRTTDPDLRVRVTVVTRTDIDTDATLEGGDILIRYDGDQLVIENA